MRDLWHFPRPDDAARIIGTLNVGLVSALAIIEPRRRGKTTFLLEDLMPAATSGELEPFLAATIKSAVADAAGTMGSLKALVLLCHTWSLVGD